MGFLGWRAAVSSISIGVIGVASYVLHYIQGVQSLRIVAQRIPIPEDVLGAGRLLMEADSNADVLKEFLQEQNPLRKGYRRHAFPRNRTNCSIPKIIHQTWKDTTIPIGWAGVQEAWKSLHPDFEYKFWTDAGLRSFVAANYAWFLPFYDAFPYDIQRVDAGRYLLLHHFGGVYADLDVEPIVRIDAFLGSHDFWLRESGTYPLASNSLMASTARNPIWLVFMYGMLYPAQLHPLFAYAPFKHVHVHETTGPWQSHRIYCHIFKAQSTERWERFISTYGRTTGIGVLHAPYFDAGFHSQVALPAASQLIQNRIGKSWNDWSTPVFRTVFEGNEIYRKAVYHALRLIGCFIIAVVALGFMTRTVLMGKKARPGRTTIKAS